MKQALSYYYSKFGKIDSWKVQQRTAYQRNKKNLVGKKNCLYKYENRLACSMGEPRSVKWSLQKGIAMLVPEH